MDNRQVCKSILDAIVKRENIEIDADDYNELIESMISYFADDFTIESDYGDFRIIADSVIDEIHDSEILELLDDVYSQALKDLPQIVKSNINWDNIARDIRFSDGVHNHFAVYDGDWMEVQGYSVFRIN
jgi:glutathionylspermidine synthase